MKRRQSWVSAEDASRFPSRSGAQQFRFSLDKSSPVPYYEQIKYQCDTALHIGDLQSHARLPAIREMAAMLQLNPKTVLKLYHRLEEEGFIEIREGSGAHVKGAQFKSAQDKQLHALVAMADRHLAEASRLKLTPQQYLALLREMVEGNYRSRSACLIAECNTEQIALFAREIRNQLGVTCHGVLLQDLLEGKGAAEALIGEASFFVTTDFHWAEVERVALRHGKTPLKVRLSPSFFRMLMNCASRGGIVMIVSNLDFFANFQRSLRALGHQSKADQIFAALPSDRAVLAKLFKEVKHVYISPLCDPSDLPPLPPWIEKMRFDTHLSSDSFDSLRNALLACHLQRELSA